MTDRGLDPEAARRVDGQHSRRRRPHRGARGVQEGVVADQGEGEGGGGDGEGHQRRAREVPARRIPRLAGQSVNFFNLFQFLIFVLLSVLKKALIHKFT